MTRKSRQIECLERLNVLAVSLDDILQYLVDEKIITKDSIKTIKSSSDHPKQVQQLLAELKSTDKIQLLEYEWQVLPVERIKLLIVTDRNTKEFAYEGS